MVKHSPVEFKLKRAPEGMTVNEEGRISPRIPDGIVEHGPVKLVITDSKGSTISHDFIIHFR